MKVLHVIVQQEQHKASELCEDFMCRQVFVVKTADACSFGGITESDECAALQTTRVLFTDALFH